MQPAPTGTGNGGAAGNLGAALYAHAAELAAVHRHNRPLLAAIAAKYNAMEFAIETVEIGVIATDDGMTWANTETRNTLGKTRDGWWLELQQYGAERVVLKRYTHIAAVWQPLYRTPLTDSRYARPVDVIIPNHNRGNELAWNTTVYPEFWIAPMVDPNEVHPPWPPPTCCRSRTTLRRRATTTTTTTSSGSSSSGRGSSTAPR